MELSTTIVIIAITAITSFGAFSNQRMMDDLIFYPPSIQRGQWWRFFSHGFIHADIGHLIFNMYALYAFGQSLERIFTFSCLFGTMGKTIYLFIYISALFMASFPDYIKYKDSYHFRSLGASGAVSAVIFSMIVFFPQAGIGIIFVPGVSIPGWLFGLIYLGVSVYLDKRGGGRVNHSAHFWGAAYGVIITVLLCIFFAKGFDVVENFKFQIKQSSSNLNLLCD